MSTPLAAPLTPEQITRRAGSSFSISFLFLDRPRRQSLTAIYAFCRVVDNAADNAAGDAAAADNAAGDVASGMDAAGAREALTFWRRELELAYARDGSRKPRTEVGLGLREAARRHGVRREDLAEILDGVAMDLEPVDCETVAELEGYCLKVASAVGLACLPVLGADRERDQAYARHLGLALQFTNILRDLRADARQGRVYAPRELRSAAGIPDEDGRSWLAGTGPQAAYAPGGPVARLVRSMADLAGEHFARSRSLLPEPTVPGLVVAEVMAAVYVDLLQRVRARGGNLLAPSPRVPGWRRLYLALRTRCRGHR